MRLNSVLVVVAAVAVNAQEYDQKIDLLRDARQVEIVRNGSRTSPTKGRSLVSRRTFEAPVRFTYTLKADKLGVSLVHGPKPVVFNWPNKSFSPAFGLRNQKPLELDGGELPAGELVSIVHEILPSHVTVTVNGVERVSADLDSSNFVAPMQLFYEGQGLSIQSVQAEVVATNSGPVQSLGLSVTPLASGGATRSGGGYGAAGAPGSMPNYPRTTESYTQRRTRKSQTVLGVDVTNVGRAEASAQVEWIFFASDVNGGEPFILNRDNRKVTVSPAKAERLEIESKEASSRTERRLNITTHDTGSQILSGSSGSQSREGIVLKGWLVRLLADGKVYAVRASAPSYEALARNDAELARVPAESFASQSSIPPGFPR